MSAIKTWLYRSVADCETGEPLDDDARPDLCAGYVRKVIAHIEELDALLKEVANKSQDVVDAWAWWQEDPYDRDQSVPHDAIDDLRVTLARIEAAQEAKE